MKGVETVDPATGRTLAAYPYTTDAELSAVLDRATKMSRHRRTADEAHPTANEAHPTTRQARPTTDEAHPTANQLRAMADRLREGIDEYARLITTEMGKPLDQARDVLRRQLDATLAAGARTLVGGEHDDRPGTWFPPTLVEVTNAAGVAFQEETFGPLGAIHAVASEAAAVDVTAASRYGLSCSIWTANLQAVRTATIAGRSS